MSRRVILLVTLSVAAIFLASFVLLQGRSDFARPLFPKPWGSDSASGSGSWLKEHLDGITGNHDANTADDGQANSSTQLDEHNKPASPALADPTDGEKEQEKKPSTAGTDSADDGSLDTAILETGGFHDEVIPTWILEVGGSHDEVIAAFIHSFGAQPNVKIELYQRMQRFGMKDIFDQFNLSHPLPVMTHKSKFKGTAEKKPKIVISTTCELDANEMDKAFTALMEAGQTYLFCVVHHAEKWIGNKQQRMIMPWAKKGLVDFVCLSKHTQNFLDNELQKWDLGGVKPVTRHLVPVFPVDMSKTKVDLPEDGLSFAIQGNYDVRRRDYNTIFDHMNKFLSNATYADLDTQETNPDIQLHLLGHGQKPEVPENLIPHVKFDEGLEYLNFYSIISKTFALIPGFAEDAYFDRKASSTVPASLIAGTPLVATQKLLDAYSYLPPETVWLQGEDEEELEVVGRVLQLPPEERKKKKAAVIEANQRRIEMNKVLAAEWIREGLAKVRKHNEEKAAAQPEVMEGVGSTPEIDAATS